MNIFSLFLIEWLNEKSRRINSLKCSMFTEKKKKKAQHSKTNLLLSFASFRDQHLPSGRFLLSEVYEDVDWGLDLFLVNHGKEERDNSSTEDSQGEVHLVYEFLEEVSNI